MIRERRRPDEYGVWAKKEDHSVPSGLYIIEGCKQAKRQKKTLDGKEDTVAPKFQEHLDSSSPRGRDDDVEEGEKGAIQGIVKRRGV